MRGHKKDRLQPYQDGHVREKGLWENMRKRQIQNIKILNLHKFKAFAETKYLRAKNKDYGTK